MPHTWFKAVGKDCSVSDAEEEKQCMLCLEAWEASIYFYIRENTLQKDHFASFLQKIFASHRDLDHPVYVSWRAFQTLGGILCTPQIFQVVTRARGLVWDFYFITLIYRHLLLFVCMMVAHRNPSQGSDHNLLGIVPICLLFLFKSFVWYPVAFLEFTLVSPFKPVPLAQL